jgi:TPR repeat protein
MYEQGRGVPRDLQQARQLYAKAADKGDAAAKAGLSRLGPLSATG